MKLLIWVFSLLCSALCLAEARVVEGELDGVPYRIEFPEKWNKELVVYAHGLWLAEEHYSFQHPDDVQIRNALLAEGVAVAESLYSRPGLAVKQGVEESEALRHFFEKNYGRPVRTWMVGDSMGSMITRTMLETRSEPYSGGLALCSSLVSVQESIHRAFDVVAVAEVLFKGVLPDDFADPYGKQPASEEVLQKALSARPAEAAQLAQAFAINEDVLLPTLWFMHGVMRDTVQEAGGNPFDNLDVIYSGFKNSGEINRKVRRVTAEPKAQQFMWAYSTPTGKLDKPLLAVQTVIDEALPAAFSNRYADLVARQGKRDKFALLSVDAEGHCNFTDRQLTQSLHLLREWQRTGERPAPGMLD